MPTIKKARQLTAAGPLAGARYRAGAELVQKTRRRIVGGSVVGRGVDIAVFVVFVILKLFF